MSRRGKDFEYRPKTAKVEPVRSARRTRKGAPVDNFEAKLESDTEGESYLSDSGTIIGDSPRQRKTEIEEDWCLEELWTPATLNTQARRVSDQCSKVSERIKKREMSETNNMERLMEMLISLRQDDRKEEREREERREGEKIRERREKRTKGKGGA